MLNQILSIKLIVLKLLKGKNDHVVNFISIQAVISFCLTKNDLLLASAYPSFWHLRIIMDRTVHSVRDVNSCIIFMQGVYIHTIFIVTDIKVYRFCRCIRLTSGPTSEKKNPKDSMAPKIAEFQVASLWKIY